MVEVCEERQRPEGDDRVLRGFTAKERGWQLYAGACWVAFDSDPQQPPLSLADFFGAEPARRRRGLWVSGHHSLQGAYVAASLVGFAAGRQEGVAEATKARLPRIPPGSPSAGQGTVLPPPTEALEWERADAALRARIADPAVARRLTVERVLAESEALARSRGRTHGWYTTHIDRLRDAALALARTDVV